MSPQPRARRHACITFGARDVCVAAARPRATPCHTTTTSNPCSVSPVLLSDLAIGPNYSALAMLRLGCRRTLAVVLRRHTDVARYASNSAISSHHPNAPLELDPAFQALLRDVEISLRNKLPPNTSGGRGPRELEVFPHDPDTTLDYLTSAELDAQDEGFGKEHRKSPAAAFGSQRIGAVALPLELQSSIERMVAAKCFLRPPCSSCNLSASRCYC